MSSRWPVSPRAWISSCRRSQPDGVIDPSGSSVNAPLLRGSRFGTGRGAGDAAGRAGLAGFAGSGVPVPVSARLPARSASARSVTTLPGLLRFLDPVPRRLELPIRIVEDEYPVEAAPVGFRRRELAGGAIRVASHQSRLARAWIEPPAENFFAGDAAQPQCDRRASWKVDER